ncbi:MAG: hypothetical protein WA192_03685 [Candidatus Acidiferrales bacterium]
MKRLWLAAVLVLFPVSFAAAQNNIITEQGLKPYGSYHGGDIDVVNLSNGKIDFHAPVVSYPQRGGKLPMGFVLRYDNPTPEVDQLCHPPGNQCTYSWEWVGNGVQVVPSPNLGMSILGAVYGTNLGGYSLLLADQSVP